MTLHDEIKKGLVEAIAVSFWAMKDGDAHDLKDACDVAHTSMKAAMIYIQHLEAERDAAVEDMTEMAQYVSDNVCAWCDQCECERGCMGTGSNSGFNWRGVQKEE